MRLGSAATAKFCWASSSGRDARFCWHRKRSPISAVYPVLAPYLAGTEASGLYESRLGKEELPEKENHVFCAAYRANEFDELLQYADHIVFNSPRQLDKIRSCRQGRG